MSDYRLLSYKDKYQHVFAGLLLNDRVYSLLSLKEYFDGADFPADSVFSVFSNWAESKSILDEWAEKLTLETDVNSTHLDDVELTAPISPGTLYCAGANFVDHVEEMTGKAPIKDEMKPYFFVVPHHTAEVGTGERVNIPKHTQKLDWEAEVALVIGKEARNVDVSSAMDYVAGYTILNDLSCRDHIKRFDVPFLFDWIAQKCFPGSNPTGPWITPASAVDDPSNLAMKLWVNEELHQDSNTNQMIFSHAELIAYLSSYLTLYPGDVVATGTPAGVGHGKGVYLKSGDVIRVSVDQLGELVTKVN